jgi:ATP-dependent Clp protease ATP-binding subunit ClpA
MTSNLGSSSSKKALGFVPSSSEDRIIDAAKRAFPPELWNRIDEVTSFESLDHNEVKTIACKMLERLKEQLKAEHSVHLEIDEKVISKLAIDGFDNELGARPLRRLIRRSIEKILVDAILAQEVLKDQTARIELDNNNNWSLIVLDK